MGNITLIYLISLFIVVVHNVDSLISDHRACFDRDCSEVLSKAKTLIGYFGNEERILSFKPNENVKVFSKSAGNRKDLWGVEINGKRGYAPKEFLQEVKVIKQPSVVVLTEIYELDKNNNTVLKKIVPKPRSNIDIQSTPTEALPSNDKFKPSPVTDASILGVEGVKLDATPTYQVIDGTTIPNDSYEASTQSVRVDEAPPVKQPDYEVHEDEEDDETVESDEDEDEFYESSTEEDDTEDVEKTDDTSTTETSREDKVLRNEKNILSPEVVQVNKNSDVNVNGAEIVGDVPDNSMNDSVKDIINSEENELPIVSNSTNDDSKLNAVKLDSINPKENVLKSSDSSVVVNPIVENVDVASLKEIESVQNNSVVNEPIPNLVNVDVNNLISSLKISDGANNDPNTQDKDDNIKNDFLKSDSTQSTGAELNLNNFVNAATAEAIASLKIPVNADIKSDENVFNVSESAEKFDAKMDSVPAVNISQDTANVSDDISNIIPKGGISVETKDVKDNLIHNNINSNSEEIKNSMENNENTNSEEIKNSMENIENTNSEETKNSMENIENTNSEETKNSMENNENTNSEETKKSIENNNVKSEISQSTSGENQINLNDSEEDIKPEEAFVPNIININEPNTNLNLKDEQNIKVDPGQQQIPQAPSVNSDHAPSISPLSQLVHRSLPDSYYSNEKKISNSESINVQDNLNDAHNESTNIDLTIQIESGDSKSEEVTENPLVENVYDKVHDSIIDPYKQLYQSNENVNLSPMEETIHESVTPSDVNGNVDITESLNSLFPPEEIILDPPGEESKPSDSMFKWFYETFMSFYKSNEAEKNPPNSGGILGPDSPDVSVGTNVQDDHDRSQEFLSAIFPAQQCNPEDKIPSGWMDISTDLIFWMILSAASVLMFTLGFYYLENRKQDGKLLAMVNSLQKELLCSSKENVILREDLGVTKEKLFGIEDSSFGSNEMVACLKKELADSEQTIADLQDKLTSAEEELANSTEAALELQSILDEQLNSKDTSSASLTFTVTNLQSQLDDQQTTMNMTKAQLAAKVEENELLLMKIVDMGNKSTLLGKDITELINKLKEARDDNESKALQIGELVSNREKIVQKMEDQRMAEVKGIQAKMQHAKDEMDSAKVLLKARIQEVASLQENLKLLKLDDKNFEAIVDVSQTKAELTHAVSENSILLEKLEMEKTAQAELIERMNEQEAKMSQMKEQLNEAEQNALQSTSRLEVLTNYFNQKEADLLKELSTKEALWLSQQGEAVSTVDKIQSLQQEIQQYKQMSESVKRELAEQEASWRARFAALEKKAHEQWLARRAAERSSQAMEKEAQALRQRLSGPSPNDKRVVSPLNVMDSVPDVGMILPPGMGPMPPLPLPLPLPMSMGFLPPPSSMMLPPPLPPLPPHRPPPLGRLSSPSPNNNRYSPDSRYSPDRYSPDTRRSTPQHNRMRSPFSPTESRRRGYNHNGRYEDDRYYDSGDDRRLRRYEETETDLSPPPSPPPPRRLPPPQRHNNHNHKGISSGSGQSS